MLRYTADIVHNRSVKHLVVAVLAIVSLSCIAVETPVEIEITPEVRPPEIEGARWQELPLHYCVSSIDAGFVPPSAFAESVEAAFERWGVTSVNEGACGSDPVAGNQRNEIGWGTPPDPGDGLHASGYTRLLYQGCLGGCDGGSESQLIEADVFIHPDPPQRLRDEDCLFSTLLHEIGHFIGLPHLDPPAIMASVSRNCPQRLIEADYLALEALYPE